MAGSPLRHAWPVRTSASTHLSYRELQGSSEFRFVLKESIDETLAARAEIVTDPGERRRAFSADVTGWYRRQTVFEASSSTARWCGSTYWFCRRPRPAIYGHGPITEEVP